MQANEQLAARRAEELKAYLVREGNVPPHLIEHHAEGVAWNMLREQVVASDMAGRNEVLDILDHTPLWIYDDKGHIVDGRKKQLMDLQKGKPYNYMLEHFFPDLRNSVNITLYLHVVEKNCEKQPEAAPSYKAENTESLQTILTKAPADKEIAHPATSTPTTVDVKPVRSYPANTVGVHAGYCTSWITSYGLTSSAKPGYEIGVTDRVRLSRQLPFYLRTGVSFINKGYEVNGFDDSRTTMNYIQIPVGIDYTVALGKHFAFIPFAGLYYAVGIGGKREVEDEKISIFKKEGGFSRHDMGVSCGVDAAFGRFIIGADYHTGLIDIDKTDTMYGEDNHKVGYKHVRNHCFIVRMGINF